MPRTVWNNTPSTLAPTWCCTSGHYRSGVHVGLLGRATCKTKTHQINPGGRMTFDHQAPNGTAITALVATLPEV